MNTFTGIVEKGTQRASALGFPTINIPLGDSEESGIFAGYVSIDRKTYAAAVYADQKHRVLEAHLLDADLDLYGKEVRIVLVKKIRDDQSFDNDAALRVAIEADVHAVWKHFKLA